MILRTLEGEVTTSDCLGKDVCEREAICATRVIWEKIEKSINEVIDNITLQDVLDQQRELYSNDYII